MISATHNALTQRSKPSLRVSIMIEASGLAMMLLTFLEDGLVVKKKRSFSNKYQAGVRWSEPSLLNVAKVE